MIFRRQARASLTANQRRAAWQVCSLILEYPGERLLADLPLLQQAVAGLPERLAEPLREVLAYLGATPLPDLERAYVETFDLTRKGCLYLSYFSGGDTRRRGVELVAFKQAYRRAGVEYAADELPDHLCVVLEFGATVDPDVAHDLLQRHRASIEVLRRGLEDRQSPWAPALLAVSRTLPDLGPDESVALARLIEQGPPTEDVGIDPYALDPRLNPRPDDDVVGATTGAPR